MFLKEIRKIMYSGRFQISEGIFYVSEGGFFSQPPHLVELNEI